MKKGKQAPIISWQQSALMQLTLPAPEIGGSSVRVGSEGLSSAGTQELSWMPDSSGPMPVMMVPQLGALTEGI